MRVAGWNDYELLDASDGGRFERWGEAILIRPDPQVIWKTPREHPMQRHAYVRYLCSNIGSGCWEEYRTVPGVQKTKYRELTFQLKTMGFGHTGIFPEQAANWDFVGKRTREVDRPMKVLDLFGCTGAAALACASAGAEVYHVNVSEGIVAWVRENAVVSGLSDKPVRWSVDDCVRFAQREQRRGSTCDGIIMSLPSYRRGSGGEVWKLEEQLYPLVQLCVPLLSKDALFFVSNFYTTGLSPSVMAYSLGALLQTQLGGSVSVDGIGLPATQSGLVLPYDNTAIWVG